MVDVAFRVAGAGDYQNTETYADVIVPSGSGTLQKHSFQVNVELRDQTTTSKTLNWELKNITKNTVLASGSHSYDSDTYHTVTKTIETTSNYIGDTVRARVWLTSGTADLLTVAVIVQSWFS